MPIQSKYSNAQVEQLMAQINQTFKNDDAPNDLKLMVLGNLVSQLVTDTIPVAQQELITEQFCAALKRAVNTN